MMPPEDTLPRSDAGPTDEPSPIAPECVNRKSEIVNFFSARLIAEALACTKKTVHRTAVKRAWPSRANGNAIEYQPPADIASKCETLAASTLHAPDASMLRTGFSDLTHDDTQRIKVLLRESAVLHYKKLVSEGFGKEFSLSAAVMHSYREAAKVGLAPSPNDGRSSDSLSSGERAGVRGKEPREVSQFSTSANSVRTWTKLYDASVRAGNSGLDALVEQKQGRCGRKSALFNLDPEEIVTLRNKGRAIAIDKGHGGKPNAAAAFRELSADPTLPQRLRSHVHGAHASKSHVTPSIRDLITPDPVTTALCQIGTRHTRLSVSPWTNSNWDNVRALDVVTADDMTANVYVWTEWPNERGWILIRPQILAALDCGTLTWLNLRAVIRAKGQYNKDDVWGLVGDVLDTYGRPKAFLFEGGTWRSNIVKGYKTGLDDSVRFGGLKSLGIQLFHSRLPRSKPIEAAFNILQTAADSCKGYCGREEKTDLPEHIKRAKYLCEAGQAHPKDFFYHVSQYADHLTQVMHQLNNERNDGKILKGSTPADRWLKDAGTPASAGSAPSPSGEGRGEGNGTVQTSMVPNLSESDVVDSLSPGERAGVRGTDAPDAPTLLGLGPVADSAKWLYRAAYNIVQVTANGVKVSLRSGKYQQNYWYDNRAALQPITGRKVAVFWNDYDPDTDAIILLIGKTGQLGSFHCVAPRLRELARFSATKEELTAEAQRKALSMQMARTESRALAPYMQRPPAHNLTRGPSAADSLSPGERAGVRGTGPSEVDALTPSDQINDHLAAARTRQEQKEKTRAKLRREISAVEVTDEMLAAATRNPDLDQDDATAGADNLTRDDISHLFTDD